MHHYFTSIVRSITLLLVVLFPFSTAVAQPGVPSDDSETFVLELKNADILSLIETVSVRTGKNFIVDPRVKAKVTVVSSSPVDATELYDIFVSVLEVHGYATVPAGSYIKIVPMSVGVKSAVPVLSERTRAGDALVTQVIQPGITPAQQIVQALRPLLSETAVISAEPNSNTVVVTDTAANIEKLSEVIRALVSAN